MAAYILEDACIVDDCVDRVTTIKQEFPQPPELTDTTPDWKVASKDRVIVLRLLRGNTSASATFATFVRTHVKPVVIQDIREMIEQTMVLFDQLTRLYYDLDESGLPHNKMSNVAIMARQAAK
jgi:hypothetical protein